jgi:hypothetical protein
LCQASTPTSDGERLTLELTIEPRRQDQTDAQRLRVATWVCGYVVAWLRASDGRARRVIALEGPYPESRFIAVLE